MSIGHNAANSSTRDATTVIGLRDRALIGLVVYSFARVGAAIGVHVEHVYTQNRRLWVRLHEKGGERHYIAGYGTSHPSRLRRTSPKCP